MAVVACKLPAGLSIRHAGAVLTLAGSNIGEDLENVSRNGRQTDNARRVHGFGLTELNDADADVFTDWANKATYQNGSPSDGKLSAPFPALENGSILGPFKTLDEARRECAAMAGVIATGFEGLDPEKEGVEENDEAPKGGNVKKK